MSTPTPRTDAVRLYIRTRDEYQKTDFEVWSEHANALERELAAAQRELAEARVLSDDTATKLLHTVNDRNRLGVQLDLVRDEIMRIRARVGESTTIETWKALDIFSYCDRAQKDVETAYSVIGERDKAQTEARELRIKVEDLRTDLQAAQARIALLEANQCEKEPSAWKTSAGFLYDKEPSLPAKELYGKARNGN